MSGDTSDRAPFRPPNAGERAIFRQLVEPEFGGRNMLREQLADCLAREIGGNGGLMISVRSGEQVRTRWRIPVEGEQKDADGILIHVLLHVTGGVVRELEFYKDDGSMLVSPIDPSQLELFCQPLTR